MAARAAACAYRSTATLGTAGRFHLQLQSLVCETYPHSGMGRHLDRGRRRLTRLAGPPGFSFVTCIAHRRGYFNYTQLRPFPAHRQLPPQFTTHPSHGPSPSSARVEAREPHTRPLGTPPYCIHPRPHIPGARSAPLTTRGRLREGDYERAITRGRPPPPTSTK